MSTLMTPVFVASFVHLNKPRSIEAGQEPKYSLTVVLRNDNKEHVAFLKDARAACAAAAKEKFGGKVPKKLKTPFRDGDEFDNRPEWADCVVFTASASEDYRPGCVDKDRERIIDPEELYSGMHCRVSLRPFAWDHKTGGKGVSLGLGNVQKVKDGEKLGGGARAEEEFGAWDDSE